MSVLGDLPRGLEELSKGKGVSPVVDADDAICSVRNLRELQARKDHDALEQWQRAREAAFAEMIYDDLSILDDAVAQLADRSKASATARKYASHWAKFTKWVAEFTMDDGYPLSALPACAELCAFYLLTELTRGQSYSAVKQGAAAISDAHVSNNLPDPMQSLVCRAAIRLARQRAGQFPQSASPDKGSAQPGSNGKANGKLNGAHKEASDGHET